MKFWILCICSFFLSGCSTDTIFQSYPHKMAPTITELKHGEYAPAIKTLSEDEKSNNYELYAAELGRIQQLSGDYSGSSATFMPLMTKIEIDQLGPKVQARSVLDKTGSMLSNDNAIPYQLRGYEIIELYQSEALNYMANQDPSDALVSLRKANLAQAQLEAIHQVDLKADQAQLKAKQLDTSFLDDPKSALSATLEAGAGVKSAYLNAMTYYLFALLNLNQGNLNDAAAALKQAIAISPDNSYLQTALLQTLSQQGASASIIQNYLTAFDLTRVPPINPKNGTLVIWYDDALIPAKTGVDIPLPIIGLDQIQMISFPIYHETPGAPIALQVDVITGTADRTLTPTQVITNTYGLAAKQLDDEYPAIFLRAALRLISKTVATNAANQSSSLFGLGMQIYSIFSSQPDLRSWLTLPLDTQIAQYSLPPKTYQVTVQKELQKAQVSATIAPGHISIIWVTSIGNQLAARVVE